MSALADDKHASFTLGADSDSDDSQCEQVEMENQSTQTDVTTCGDVTNGSSVKCAKYQPPRALDECVQILKSAEVRVTPPGP